MKKCLVLLSGGVDSATLAYWMRNQGYQIEALFFDFGTSLVDGPRRAAKDIASNMGIFLHQIKTSLWSDALQVAGSSRSSFNLQHRKKNYDKKGAFFCNVSCLTTMSIVYAATLRRDQIAFGIHADDIVSNPDFTLNLMRSIEKIGRTILYQNLRILTPFARKNKASIVRIGLELGVPFGLSWSCGKDSDIHCGTCADCKARQLAFAMAHYNDPTKYNCVAKCNRQQFHSGNERNNHTPKAGCRFPNLSIRSR